METKDFENDLFVRNYLELGHLALEYNNATEALRCAGKALEADAENVPAWLLKLAALMLSGDKDEALLKEIARAGNKAIECSNNDAGLKRDILKLYRDYLLP